MFGGVIQRSAVLVGSSVAPVAFIDVASSVLLLFNGGGGALTTIEPPPNWFSSFLKPVLAVSSLERRRTNTSLELPCFLSAHPSVSPTPTVAETACSNLLDRRSIGSFIAFIASPVFLNALPNPPAWFDFSNICAPLVSQSPKNEAFSPINGKHKPAVETQNDLLGDVDGDSEFFLELFDVAG